jgi:hypothetical protein
MSYTEKEMHNVKLNIAPPSILDEIKKEVSEYSFSQQNFLRQNFEKKGKSSNSEASINKSSNLERIIYYEDQII